MTTETQRSWAGFVWLLLDAQRRRARSRMRAAAERRRGGAPAIVYALALFSAIFIQAWFAFAGNSLAKTAFDLEAADSGKIAISQHAYDAISAYADIPNRPHESEADRERLYRARSELDKALWAETPKLIRRRGGTVGEWHGKLEEQFHRNGKDGFVVEGTALAGMDADIAYRILTFLILCWWLALVLQGEGVALDTQRRRHPMWEWYLGFPIPQSAVLTAEALAPVASNPYLLMSPVMLATLVGILHSPRAGLCALPLAIPLTLAAAIWAKALEVLIMLRSSVRNRSGWFALLAMIGFVAQFAPFVLMQSPDLIRAAAHALLPFAQWLPGAQWLLEADSLATWLRAMATSCAIGVTLALPLSR